MSDTGTTDAAVEAAAAEVGSANYAEPAAEPAAESVLDAELPDGMQKFDRTYVEKVRSEAAKNRVAAKEAQEALEAQRSKYAEFEQYDDADLQVWKQMAATWQTDPSSAASTMRAIANNVLGDPTATTAEKVEAAQTLEQIDNAEQTGETQDIEKIIEERLQEHTQQQELETQVRAIETKLGENGYEKGTMEYASVLWYASNDPEVGGSIDKAMEKMQSFKQSVIDEYVQSVAAGKQPPGRVPGAPAGQAGDSAVAPPTNVKEATQQARAWLEGRSRA
jgi:ATP-dependent Lon protease